jgi:hypothetical protein
MAEIWYLVTSLNRDIHFTCILCLLNNTCGVKHNFKSVHVSNLFWSREYNSAKEIYKYPSFSKVWGNYPLDLKIIWYFVLCLLYITDTIPWQAVCISTTLKYNRSLEKHVLAHFQRTTCSQIYFRFSSYLLRKPLLIRSTAFICSECTITHTYCCVSKLFKFGAYVYAVNDNTVVYINNTFLSLRNSIQYYSWYTNFHEFRW